MSHIPLIPLDLLRYSVSTRLIKNESFLKDEVRKKWVKVTPEELVRQHLIQYLLKEKNYPGALMKLEHPLTLNELKKRSDIVIYSREGKPWMLVECKAAHIKLTQETLDQAARYNIKLDVKYLVVCNGIEALAVKFAGTETSTYQFLQDLPAYGL